MFMVGMLIIAGEQNVERMCWVCGECFDTQMLCSTRDNYRPHPLLKKGKKGIYSTARVKGKCYTHFPCRLHAGFTQIDNSFHALTI